MCVFCQEESDIDVLGMCQFNLLHHYKPSFFPSKKTPYFLCRLKLGGDVNAYSTKCCMIIVHIT